MSKKSMEKAFVVGKSITRKTLEGGGIKEILELASVKFSDAPFVVFHNVGGQRNHECSDWQLGVGPKDTYVVVRCSYRLRTPLSSQAHFVGQLTVVEKKGEGLRVNEKIEIDERGILDKLPGTYLMTEAVAMRLGMFRRYCDNSIKRHAPKVKP